MGNERLILLFLVILGVVARNGLIVVSAAVLIVLQHLRLDALYPHLEERGVELGLVLLLIAVLVPFASGRIGVGDIRGAVLSADGLAAIAGGMLAAALSGRGIALLQGRPEVIVGLVIGSVLGVILLRGIPVGPLAAAGFTAVLLRLFGRS